MGINGRGRAALLAALLALSTVLGAGRNTTIAAGPGSRSARLCIFDHTALRTAPGTCRPQARSYPSRVTGSVRKAIYDGALTFGVPYVTMLQIAKCESGLNPRASSRKYFGLFQFLPATFKTGVRMMLRNTGITAKSYWNARDASYVTGFVFAIGGARAWTCTEAIPGIQRPLP